MKMKSEILNREFDCTITHLGLRLDDNLWQHDKWNVTIEGKDFEYSTGIGHREPKRKAYERGFKNYRGFKDEATYYLKERFTQDRENLKLVNAKIEKFTTVKKPDLDDVLHNLLLDSEALDYSYDDWCDNFGYDTDSRKALDIYEQCIKNAHKVRKFISDLGSARELFQDY